MVIMRIAFIADDFKKELVSAFTIAYKNILQKHEVFATGTTGSIIKEATGLDVYLFSNGHLGAQQIIARAAYNEIDLVFYFKDTIQGNFESEDIKNLLSICDSNNIPYATNLASAEVLISGLQRGDIDWRNYL
jgi:methylglyoxal synthase